jgi:hypothetical protein
VNGDTFVPAFLAVVEPLLPFLAGDSVALLTEAALKWLEQVRENAPPFARLLALLTGELRARGSVELSIDFGQLAAAIARADPEFVSASLSAFLAAVCDGRPTVYGGLLRSLHWQSPNSSAVFLAGVASETELREFLARAPPLERGALARLAELNSRFADTAD